MNDGYLQKLEEILKRTRPRLASRVNLEYRNAFGAVAGYAGNNIFIVCGSFGIAVKLPPKTLERLFQDKEAKPFKYFPKGHVKKEYANLSNDITDNKEEFGKLLDIGIKFVNAP